MAGAPAELFLQAGHLAPPYTALTAVGTCTCGAPLNLSSREVLHFWASHKPQEGGQLSKTNRDPQDIQELRNTQQ